MDMIRTALLGATALSLTIGFGATTVLAAGPNQNAASMQNHGAGIPMPPKALRTRTKTYAATVSSTGSLVRGAGATGSLLLGTGIYEVDFSVNVSGCAYIATLGNATYGTAPAGFITDAERAGNPDGVFVKIANPSGAATDENFHLAVVCPG
jgi:hypothetical protein